MVTARYSEESIFRKFDILKICIMSLGLKFDVGLLGLVVVKNTVAITTCPTPD